MNILKVKIVRILENILFFYIYSIEKLIYEMKYLRHIIVLILTTISIFACNINIKKSIIITLLAFIIYIFLLILEKYEILFFKPLFYFLNYKWKKKNILVSMQNAISSGNYNRVIFMFEQENKLFNRDFIIKKVIMYYGK